jgi:hypothetical protein
MIWLKPVRKRSRVVQESSFLRGELQIDRSWSPVYVKEKLGMTNFIQFLLFSHRQSLPEWHLVIGVVSSLWSVADKEFILNCIIQITGLLEGFYINLEENPKPAKLIWASLDPKDEN